MSAERLRALTDEDLGGAIRSLPIEWPTPPDISDAVVETLSTGSRARWRPSSRTRVLLLVAAIVLALATAAAAARYVMDLGAVVVERPTEPARSLPDSPVPIAGLGERIALARARDAVDFPVRVPARLGRPDSVWLFRTVTAFDQPETVAVAMAWRAGPREPRIEGSPFNKTLMVFHGEIDVAIKLVGGRIHQFPEHDAIGLTGRHELDLLVGGDLRRYRVEDTVLLWQRGDTTSRLEIARPLPEAISLVFG